MSKYSKIFSRFVIISTYAIIFSIIGNMIVPALIVEKVHAQEMAATTANQTKLTLNEQKAYDKLKAETIATTYKELGLTKSEIQFSDANDMDSIFKKADKYVIYNNKTGIAQFNANSYMHDGTVKLSKANTNIVISIVNKMISNYNKSIISIPTLNETVATGISSSQKQISASGNTSIVVTKSIATRGVDISIQQKNSTTTSGVSAQSISAPSDGRTQVMNKGWWGFDLFISHELVNKMFWIMVVYGVVSVSSLLYTIPGIITACSLLGPISWAMCAVGGALIMSFAYLTWSFRNDDIYCGQRGVYYQFRTWSGGGSTKALCQ